MAFRLGLFDDRGNHSIESCLAHRLVGLVSAGEKVRAAARAPLEPYPQIERLLAPVVHVLVLNSLSFNGGRSSFPLRLMLRWMNWSASLRVGSVPTVSRTVKNVLISPGVSARSRGLNVAMAEAFTFSAGFSILR